MNQFYTFRKPYPKMFFLFQFIYYIYRKKNYELLHLVTNYYEFNNIIILIHYLITLINKFQDDFIKIKYFININLKCKFYFIWIIKKEK